MTKRTVAETSAEPPARATFEGAQARVAAVVFVAVIAAVAVRLRYGVDFVDEAFYAAIPYRFAMGAKPFEDEVAVQQTAQILLTPLVRAYVLVTGGITGLMLFLRGVWLVMMLMAAASSFALLRRISSAWLAMLASLTIVAVIPFYLPSPSYNTMGAALLIVAVNYGLLALTLGDCPKAGVASGFCFAALGLVYPTLFVAGPVFLVLAWMLGRGAVTPPRSGLRWMCATYVTTAFAEVLLLEAVSKPRQI